MDIYTKLNKIKKIKNSVVTIGAFDGVHVGHMEVLKKLKEIGENKKLPLAILTFDPHPQVLLGNKNHKVLMTRDDKLNIFEKLEIDYVFFIPFDENLIKISAYEFLNDYIVDKFNPTDVVIGYDHRFGFKREGDIEFLKKYRLKYNYEIHQAECKQINSINISSSNIKKILNNGDIENANLFLGYNYKINGFVVKGNGKGRKINFPTANIKLDNIDQIIPSIGVYCVDVFVEESMYTGMCNIGYRPTFYKNGERIIEVHIITDEDLLIYGKKISLQFKDFIRSEKKYRNSDDLITQLNKDRYYCMQN